MRVSMKNLVDKNQNTEGIKSLGMSQLGGFFVSTPGCNVQKKNRPKNLGREYLVGA